MRKVKTILPNGCSKCGCFSATIYYENGSNIAQAIICDQCGEDLR